MLKLDINSVLLKPIQNNAVCHEGLGLGLVLADKRLDDASTSEGNASPRPRKGMPWPRPRLGHVDRCLGLASASELNASASELSASASELSTSASELSASASA